MKNLLPACLLLSLLTACGGGTVRDTLGLTHRAPDEFTVVSRPPLSVPPEFNLRPPGTPGESAPNAAQPAYKQAQTLVMGDGASGTQPVTLSPGNAATAVQPVTAGDLGRSASAAADPAESQFLQDAGAAKADPTIRQTLKQETAANSDDNKDFIDKMRAPSDNEPVVDAAGESARLKGDKIANQPPTTGDTPMVSPKDTGTLGRIFGY